MSDENFSPLEFLKLVDRRLDEKVKFINRLIDEAKVQDTQIFMREICGPSGREVEVRDPRGGKTRKMLMFGSNNYLGFAHHAMIAERVRERCARFGLGLGGPPLLNGYTSLHAELERKLADAKGKEAALLFSSGYLANMGWVTGLIGPEDAIIFDEDSHASFIAGLKINQLRPRTFRHNDMASLRERLDEVAGNDRDIFVTTEGVFSMSGDVAKLDEIIALKREYGFYLVVDDAHGLGTLGEKGHGVHEHFRTGEIDVIMGTFSKTLAATGGFLAASQELVDFLRFTASSYMFSASLPPAVVAQVLSALEMMDSEPWRIQNLRYNTRYLIERLEEVGIRVRSDSAIVGVPVERSIDIRRLCRNMHDRGIFVNVVEPPAVPPNGQRIRISLMAEHTEEDLDRLARELSGALGELRARG
jgi:glycine C-acetyltransferase